MAKKKQTIKKIGAPVRVKVVRGFVVNPQKLVFRGRSLDISPNSPAQEFTLSEFPRSVNHMRIHTRTSSRLEPWVYAFRETVKKAVESNGIILRPDRLSAVSIEFFSPVWVTKAGRIRVKDVDNLVKPILDALEIATGYPDENVWELYVAKRFAPRISLKVTIFDVGDIVEYHGY